METYKDIKYTFSELEASRYTGFKKHQYILVVNAHQINKDLWIKKSTPEKYNTLIKMFSLDAINRNLDIEVLPIN